MHINWLLEHKAISILYQPPWAARSAIRWLTTNLRRSLHLRCPSTNRHQRTSPEYGQILVQSRHPSVAAAWSFSSRLSHAGTELAADLYAYAVTRYTAYSASPMDGRHRQVAPFTKIKATRETQQFKTITHHILSKALPIENRTVILYSRKN